jgi:hypothetical protein
MQSPRATPRHAMPSHVPSLPPPPHHTDLTGLYNSVHRINHATICPLSQSIRIAASIVSSFLPIVSVAQCRWTFSVACVIPSSMSLAHHHITHLVGKSESQSKLVDGSSLGVTSSSNSHGGSGSTPDGGSSNRKHCVVVSARCRVESGSIFNVVGFERKGCGQSAAES